MAFSTQNQTLPLKSCCCFYTYKVKYEPRFQFVFEFETFFCGLIFIHCTANLVQIKMPAKNKLFLQYFLLYFSGGIIVIVTRVDYLDTCPEYKGRLEPLMERLEKEGQWKKLKRDVGARFYLDKEAVCYKYEVLAKSS